MSTCSVIHNSPKVETTQMFIDWWKITIMWYNCIINYFSVNKDEILLYAIPCTNIADMLSERDKTQMSHIVSFHLHRGSRTGNPTGTKSWLVVLGGQRWGRERKITAER